MDDASSVRRIKTKFPGISSKAWEHPADRAALTAVRKVPGLDTLLQKLIGITTERSLRLITLASAVRVSTNQFPRLNRLHREACDLLDMQEVPELYVSQSPFLNAGAIGVEKPFIVLNSSIVDGMTDDEILAIVGHELGHCMSGHVLYKTLLQLLIKFSVAAFSVPLGGASILAVIIALKEWDRKSELSADRAGLLVVQDPQVYYNVLMKLAGGPRTSEMDINEFFLQAADYEGSPSVLDSMHKLLNLVGQSHPFPVLRLTELKTWVDSGAYARILTGDYLGRDNDSKDDTMNNFREAARNYREDFNNSRDPLADTLRNAMETADSVRAKAKEAFNSFFNGGGNPSNGNDDSK
ncbi:MAG TPA: M48 family metallopeptidase [Candidatus Kapabacteria bacterium]|nr:M48 family metallopeptidase [Candidatus Kapabacteria bacterium]